MCTAMMSTHNLQGTLLRLQTGYNSKTAGCVTSVVRHQAAAALSGESAGDVADALENEFHAPAAAVPLCYRAGAQRHGRLQ